MNDKKLTPDEVRERLTAEDKTAISYVRQGLCYKDEEAYLNNIAESLAQLRADLAEAIKAFGTIKNANQSVRKNLKKGSNINIVLDAIDKFIDKTLAALIKEQGE